VPRATRAAEKKERRPAAAELHLIARADDEPNGEDAGEVTDEGIVRPDCWRRARSAARGARVEEAEGNRHEIWDEDKKEFRPAEWSDMAVLLRSAADARRRSRWSSAVPECAGCGARRLFESLEVSDLLSCSSCWTIRCKTCRCWRCCARRSSGCHSMNWRKFAPPLRSAILDALVRFEKGSEPGSPEPRVRSNARSVAKIETFLAQFAPLARARAANFALAMFGDGPGRNALRGDVAAGRAGGAPGDVRQLLDLARQFDPYQRQGLYRFLRFVSRRRTRNWICSQPRRRGGLRKLLSIHKSKGLDSPIVVLAGMGTKIQRAGPQ